MINIYSYAIIMFATKIKNQSRVACAYKFDRNLKIYFLDPRPKLLAKIPICVPPYSSAASSPRIPISPHFFIKFR